MDADDFKDLPKKYSHTYFQYRPIGSQDNWNTCFAEDIRIISEIEEYFRVFISGEWYSSIDYEFKFDFPPIGVLNYKDTVVIASKFPARQWKKAATKENYTVYFPMYDLLQNLHIRYILPKKATLTFPWNTAGIKLLFNNTFFSLKDATSALQKGKRIACAITKEFFVTNSHYNNSILLWRYNTIVAEIEDIHITYVEPMFEQEARDFFKRNV